MDKNQSLWMGDRERKEKKKKKSREGRVPGGKNMRLRLTLTTGSKIPPSPKKKKFTRVLSLPDRPKFHLFFLTLSTTF